MEESSSINLRHITYIYYNSKCITVKKNEKYYLMPKCSNSNVSKGGGLLGLFFSHQPLDAYHHT